ncbi:hypothetical protein SEUCBS140593_004580 [Sporothrix eucalyptigena]|uniref:Uncharacterized protein n=1 Tax=Sporothrix eucalyptigena TaxID=1812306 RepID=A0ABP0BPA8_9PEZI
MAAANSFTREVVSRMQTLYPEELADKAWDNVGLLLENSRLDDQPVRKRVLLTNDLTPDVVDEAISYQVSVIVAYHPFIFRGLKSITLQDPQQASLLRLAQNNIAVYCPHTALDAGIDGINDWLASCVDKAARQLNCPKTSTVVVKSKLDALAPSNRVLDSEGLVLDVGYGRITSLYMAMPAEDLIREVLKAMGLSMSHVLVARPRNSNGYNYKWNDITSVGVCAGSGFDIFRSQLGKISMLITGEVSHHDAIYATTQGVWVVCLLHSNSERRFLSAKLQSQLTRALEKSGHQDATVLVSERDRDPFEIWDVNNPSSKPKEAPESFTI